MKNYEHFYWFVLWPSEKIYLSIIGNLQPLCLNGFCSNEAQIVPFLSFWIKTIKKSYKIDYKNTTIIWDFCDF